jgi:RimJ/RimL family protein N-acetyltransferase
MTNGVHLREVTDADLPNFYEQQLDPDATRMAAFPTRDCETFLAHWRRIMADASLAKRTVLCDGQVAGNIGCWSEAGKHLVGYWFGREFWGKGVSTAALAALLTQVQERPLYAHFAEHNVASIRVLEKCGFTKIDEEAAEVEASADEVREVILILR